MLNPPEESTQWTTMGPTFESTYSQGVCWGNLLLAFAAFRGQSAAGDWQ